MHIHASVRPHHLHLLLESTTREANASYANHDNTTATPMGNGRHGRPPSVGPVAARTAYATRTPQRLLLQPLTALTRGECAATVVLREQSLSCGARSVQRDLRSVPSRRHIPPVESPHVDNVDHSRFTLSRIPLTSQCNLIMPYPMICTQIAVEPNGLTVRSRSQGPQCWARNAQNSMGLENGQL